MSKMSQKSALDTIEKVFKEYAVEGSEPPMLTQEGVLKLMIEQFSNLMKVRQDKVGCWVEGISFLT